MFVRSGTEPRCPAVISDFCGVLLTAVFFFLFRIRSEISDLKSVRNVTIVTDNTIVTITGGFSKG